MGISAKIEDILELDGGVEIRFGPIPSEHGLNKGEIFPGILIENNLYPKKGEEIELEQKFGYYVIKYNGVEIGKAKPPMSRKKD